MPYIKQSVRLALQRGTPPVTSGELAYLLSEQIRRFLRVTDLSFEGAISKVYGALEATKAAFERDVATPYEMLKRKDNGGVF